MSETRKNVNVILVGSNPLPCYIQAAYVMQGVTEEEEKGGLKKPDIIVFVVTEETEKYAKNIEAILENKRKKSGWPSVAYRQIKIADIYNSARIEKDIKEGLKDIEKELKEQNTSIRHILLNNTGGTKAMAVYATIAVREFISQSVTVTECFVDPIKNEIRCYTKKEAESENEIIIPISNFPEKGDLRDKIELDIEELVSLHYGKPTIHYDDLNGKDEKENDYTRLTKQQFLFAKDILCSGGDKIYKLYDKFFEICYDKAKNAGELEALSLEKDNASIFELIKPYFRKEDNTFDFEQLVIFTRGDWLEKYFYEALLEVAEEFRQDGRRIQTAWSYEVKPDTGGKKFEVDVLALRGYTLTLFSISMVGTGKGGESAAKGKYFEAVYRVEQMAGEHGRAVIVNFVPDKILKKFAKDLSMFNKEVEPIYRKELGNVEALKEKIRKILQ